MSDKIKPKFFESESKKTRRDDSVDWERFYKSIPSMHEQEERYIKFEISSRLTFIKSQLGTGKSTEVRRLIREGGYKTIVWISFRRTFTTANQSILSDIDFKDYRDIEGDIDLSENPRIIIQVDSIPRLEYEAISSVDLVVLDEMESIWCQLCGRASITLNQQFMRLLSWGEHVIVMDGLLNQSTINFLAMLMDEDKIKMVRNCYRPLSYNTTIREFSPKAASENGHIYETLVTRLEAGENVASIICNRSLVTSLANDLREAHPDYSIVEFTGNDLEVRDGVSMYSMKQAAFGDINTFITTKKPRWFVHTTTLTAGVSIDVDHFDSFIHVYTANVDPIEFIQATARVRLYRKNEGTIYIYNRTLPSQTNMVRYALDNRLLYNSLNGGFEMTKSLQMEIYLRTRNNFLHQYAVQLIIQHLSAIGHSFTFRPRIESSSETYAITPVDRICAESIQMAILTEERVKRLEEFTKDEYKFKKTLTEPDYDLYYFKNKARRELHMTIDEINKLDGKKIILLKSSKKFQVKQFIRSHGEIYDKLSFEEKSNLLAYFLPYRKLESLPPIPEIIKQNKIDLTALIKTQESENDKMNEKVKLGELRKIIVDCDTSQTAQNLRLQTTKLVDEIIKIFKSTPEHRIEESSTEFNQIKELILKSPSQCASFGFKRVSQCKTTKVISTMLATRGYLLEVNKQRIRVGGARPYKTYLTIINNFPH